MRRFHRFLSDSGTIQPGGFPAGKKTVLPRSTECNLPRPFLSSASNKYADETPFATPVSTTTSGRNALTVMYWTSTFLANKSAPCSGNSFITDRALLRHAAKKGVESGSSRKDRICLGGTPVRVARNRSSARRNSRSRERETYRGFLTAKVSRFLTLWNIHRIRVSLFQNLGFFAWPFQSQEQKHPADRRNARIPSGGKHLPSESSGGWDHLAHS